MPAREGVFSGDFLAGRETIEACLGRSVGQELANTIASLAEVDPEMLEDLCKLVVANGNRLLALMLLGFLVSDDGATREDLYEFVDEVVCRQVTERRAQRED